jgi:tetratricopeptide (TPR) repeat protein
MLGRASSQPTPETDVAFTDCRYTPQYPRKPPLSEVLAHLAPGSDEYVSEAYAVQIEALLKRFAHSLRESPTAVDALAEFLDPAVEASALGSASEEPLRSDFGVQTLRRHFTDAVMRGRETFLGEVRTWLEPVARIETAEFEIFGLQQISADPLALRLDIRYDLVSVLRDGRREERVGAWTTEWELQNGQWRARRWHAAQENLAIVRGPGFLDITSQALGKTAAWREQLAFGADYWRTLLDGAVGLDVYCNNGVAVGDFDNDGLDDFYVCQPAGLPNLLFRNQGDGTFEDVTEKAGVGVLDNTACALFADFDNRGLQDLLVVCGTGPLLFRNQGGGRFELKRDAFRFERPPQGTFTHAAVADYDRDGRLDIYFCLYMYYLGLDQYHYPIPYYDARNGPPNCLLHNEDNGVFIERTAVTGLDADNDRYSFACAWGDSRANGLPDLFVANDFGSSQIYRNNGDGTFTVASKEAGVEDVGAGMSCCWADYDNDGHQDIYVPSMWEAAGQRVSSQKQFHERAPEPIRALYRRHARGNALYRNRGDGTFENLGERAGVEMGRWSWCSDFLDFDHDGWSDLYVANGYISTPDREDLAGFFWRQVVAKSSEDATPAPAYERGWNAINELIRSDHTWHGYARNVLFVNNREGSFTEASGAVGLDFLEDCRCFALADFDRDGRLEIVLKSRNAPQLRILRNALERIGRAISFRLRGRTSNRDAIGARVTLEAGPLKQTKYLQAGSGFLAQHAKELFFGVGDFSGPLHATVQWPNGSVQSFPNLPADSCIEIVEGAESFKAQRFGAAPAAWAQAGPEQPAEHLPAQAESWLVEPLAAPDFALPDLSGTSRKLSSWRGRTVLLSFFSANAAASFDQLRAFAKHAAKCKAAGLDVLAISLDGAGAAASARAFVAGTGFPFPILLATDETGGIYNLIFRYLFDRRRDLGIPTSFLLDREGMIVKVWQGPADPARAAADARDLPDREPERMRRALPSRGQLYLSSFVRNDYSYGVAMYQHGYLDQAAESFRQVVSRKPSDADAYYNLGTLSLQRSDLDQARQYLEKTVQLRPDYPEAWNNLGMIAAQQGRPGEAIQSFQRALAQRAGFAPALLNLGNLYRRQRDFAQAEDFIRRALELDPNDAEINYSLGMLFAQQNLLDQGAESLQKAIALRPDYPEARNNLGVLYVRQKQYAKAEEQFKAAIRADASFDGSYLNLARLYILRDEKQNAREVLQDLLRIQPDNKSAKQALEVLE